MKKFFLALCIGFCLCYVANAYFTSTQTALADGVIRLHVIANSDNDYDQALKLKVRDRILKETGADLGTSQDMDTVRYEICKNIDYIKEVAEDEIKKNGFNYKVNVSFGLSDFPEKKYANITLPAGSYQALKVQIGEAKGQNWWCVMFPPMCFINEDCVNVDDNTQTKLKSELGDSVYSMVSSENVTYNVKFKIYELWQKGQSTIASKFRGN